MDNTLEAAKTHANELLQAMIRHKDLRESILQEPEVRIYVSFVLDAQKELVRYIHTVNDDEYLNWLVLANDQIVDVLQRLQMVRPASDPGHDRRPHSDATAWHGASRARGHYYGGVQPSYDAGAQRRDGRVDEPHARGRPPAHGAHWLHIGGTLTQRP